MGTVAAEGCLVKRFEQSLHFLAGQALIGSYHAVTCHFQQYSLQLDFYSFAAPDGGQFIDDIANKALGIGFLKHAGHFLERKSVAAKAFQGNTQAKKSVSMLLHQPCLTEIEFQYDGKKQQLSFYRTGPILLLKLFETDAFVGGVLVDKYQVLSGLTHNITVLVLPDNVQTGKESAAPIRALQILAAIGIEQPLTGRTGFGD
jgi:hypothetical protein